MLFGDEIKKVFLAGIGAIAQTVEKGQEMVDSLVEKGELTIKQGEVLNQELKHGFSDAKDDLKGGIAKKGMNILDNVEKLSHDEIKKLKEKLSELEKKK